MVALVAPDINMARVSALGTFLAGGVVSFMNNAGADVEIMPTVEQLSIPFDSAP